MNKETITTAVDTQPFTPAECQQMRDALAGQFPHLRVSVEWRDGQLYIDALPDDDTVAVSEHTFTI